MIHHYITKYKESGKYWAEAWIQINLFGKCFCFSKRKMEIKDPSSAFTVKLDNKKLNKETLKKIIENTSTNIIESTRHGKNILSDDWKELIVKNNETKEKLVTINSNGIDATSSKLVVRLVPKRMWSKK